MTTEWAKLGRGGEGEANEEAETEEEARRATRRRAHAR